LSATELKIRCFSGSADDRAEADNREGTDWLQGYLLACDEISRPKLRFSNDAVEGSGLKQLSWIKVVEVKQGVSKGA